MLKAEAVMDTPACFPKESIDISENMLNFTSLYDIIIVFKYTEACIVRRNRMIPGKVN